MKKLIALTFMCSVASFPAVAQESGAVGYYCESGTYEIVDMSGECKAPAFIDDTTGQCISSFIATDYLDITNADDGNINFSVMLTYTNGSSCGLEDKTAQMIDDNVWLYEENLIEGDSSPAANCSIKISYSADGIQMLSENENATCQAVCGMRGSLKEVVFPLATKETAKPENDYTCSRPALGLEETRLITK